LPEGHRTLCTGHGRDPARIGKGQFLEAQSDGCFPSPAATVRSDQPFALPHSAPAPPAAASARERSGDVPRSHVLAHTPVVSCLVMTSPTSPGDVPAHVGPPDCPVLLDERSRPDFGAVYGKLAEASARFDVAVRKVRLSGISLGRRELQGPARIRLLLAEINVLTLSAEAESMAAAGEGRRRLSLIRDLLAERVLHLRSAPLGGWDPDFSVFWQAGAGPVVLIGPHWFARPYPHRGPALGSLHRGQGAARVGRRFEALWSDAHPVEHPVRRVMEEALARVPAPPGWPPD
jgi:hypothetical protein